MKYLLFLQKMDKKSTNIIDQIWEMLIPKRDKCAQSVSFLQNSEIFQNTTCAQSVYLLQNSEMFKNEIKNRQKKFIH